MTLSLQNKSLLIDFGSEIIETLLLKKQELSNVL